MQYPIAFSHIGLSVPDIDKAIKFYKEVFGWYHLAGPWPIQRDSPAGPFCDTIYGTEWTGFRMAHMSTSDRVGVELFEVEGNYPSENKMAFKRHGIFHFGVTVPDYEAFLKKLEAHGGRQHSDLKRREANDQEYCAVFAEDPFGNIFEIFTHSYELMSKP